MSIFKKALGWILCLSLLGALPLRAATSDERFQAANQAYINGEFGEAAYQYRELAQTDFSPGLFHNLGNVEWKVGRPGYAIIAWERARTLAPDNRNTIANLRFARHSSQLETPERAWYEQYSEWLPSKAWLWIATLNLWCGLTLLLVPRLMRGQRADWHQGFAALAFAVFLLTIPALFGLWSRANIGIVVAEEVGLGLTPTKEAEVLTKLAGGETARIERERGDYFYIRASQDRAGWVAKRDFERIWKR